MPFWWNRRNRPWYGNWYRRRSRKYKRRRRKPYRRRYRTTYRRRRRRRRTRHKVRRKKQKLNVVQWQPTTIRKCKIHGQIVHVLGANGRQFRCYADNRYAFTKETAPSGGGFSVEKFTLQFLYEQHKEGHNYWTQSNKYLDLVRYTGCKFRVYRHPHIDFIFYYSLMYPMQLDKYTYAFTQPYKLLQKRKRKIIQSRLSKPTGKPYKIIKIKCPKQLTNKWFFQEYFADKGLVEIHTAAANIRYSYLGCCNTNQLISIKHLNLDVYKNAAWGNQTTATQGYKPQSNLSKPTVVKINGKNVNITIEDSTWANSISYDKGWFQPKLLQAEEIVNPAQQKIPIHTSRYNPTHDTGIGNKVYFLSILNSSFEPPRTDPDLIIENLPLWQALNGFSDWVRKIKKDKTYLATYYLVIQSPFIEPAHTLSARYIVIDEDVIQGKGPYGETPTDYMKSHWYPNFLFQQKTINNFVTAGPYVPKLDNQREGTWELKSDYYFYFKWGGSDLPEPEIANPEEQAKYDVPSDLLEAIQVADPSQQKASRIVHSWDFRRGLLTGSALKRIYQDSETDSTLSTDSEEPTKKKKKTPRGNSVPCKNQQEDQAHQTLLSLYSEGTSQEAQKTDIQQLIKQQQQQQHKLKLNMLKLINQLQEKQLQLQLHTGLLN